MKMKKMLLGMSTLGAIAAPVAAVVSCGTSAKNEDAKTADWSKSKIYLALDGKTHSENDKSFNQQGREAIEAFLANNTTNTQGEVLKPSGDGESDFHQMYSSANDNSIIVAPGFLHIAPLTTTTDETAGKAIVLLDGTAKKDNIVSIEFKVEQAAYLAGIAFANELLKDDSAALDALDLNGDKTIKVSTFGGMDIPTVTGFMGGFTRGFTETINGKTPAATGYHVEFFKFGTKAEHFSNSFASGAGKSVVDKMKAQHVDVILPVAGPQTLDVLNDDVNAIGVDTAQEQQYTPSSVSGHGKVVFSILKKLKEATVNALTAITTKDFSKGYNFGETTYGTLDNDLVGISNNNDSKLQAEYATALKDHKQDALNQKAEFEL